MNFIKFDDAHATLQAAKTTLEKKRRELLASQAPGFKSVQTADKSKCRQCWTWGFIVIFALVCFVINAVISLSILAILQRTIYANAPESVNEVRIISILLASTLILPAASVIFSFVRNFRIKNHTANYNRLALVNHPDYAIWMDKDAALAEQMNEIDEHIFELTHRGLIHIDGAKPASGDVMGELVLDDQVAATLLYSEMPYEFHLAEGSYRVVIRSGESIRLDQTVELKKSYATTIDIAEKTDRVDLVRTIYNTERAKMPRRGTVYVSE